MEKQLKNTEKTPKVPWKYRSRLIPGALAGVEDTRYEKIKKPNFFWFRQYKLFHSSQKILLRFLVFLEEKLYNKFR